ncbi:(2,3-dihydroxybenzoyl)adenylate synthase [Timonella sp. A28]|uniref:(2,3-dihydroxybenzoyl)adenylate synthase n=1 Tax=Timonella sp. A28 TaxID=3442640 RepID=UPI003EBAFD20
MTAVVPYPAEFIRTYLDLGLWKSQRIEQLLDTTASLHPHRTAVIDEETTLTYAQLVNNITTMQDTLHKAGVQAGDFVVLHLPNSARYIATVYALFRMHARPIFALPAHRQTDINNLVRGSNAQWVLTDEALTPTGHPHQPYIPGGAEEVAFLQLSGGTTGIPKLIPKTHRDYVYSFMRSAEICRVTHTTVFLAVLPLAHNFTMSSPGFFAVLSSGGTVVTTQDATPTTVCELIERTKVTMIAAVPPLIQLWMNAPKKPDALASLDVILVGGARLARSTAEHIPEFFGCALQQVYGMAEGLVCYTRRDDSWETTVGTQGRPMSEHDEIRIVDHTETEVAHNQPGHLLVRGPYTIRGYYNAPDINRESFTVDGFYRTGDIVRCDAQGNITVVGRIKDHINRGGEKVVPSEIEGLLLTHPAVHDACVLGREDDILGERVEGYVVAKKNQAAHLNSVLLRRHLRQCEIADFKIPDIFHIVDQLPSTGVGKIDRKNVPAHISAKNTFFEG